jgi:hypothetical protein
MARTNLATTAQANAGIDITTMPAANVDGHSLEGGGDTQLVVRNASGAPITVTFQSAATVDGLAVADLPVTVAAGVTRICKRLPPAVYDRPSGAVDAGRVYVDFSSVTSVTCLAVEAG